jgi:hypothetical protein
MILNFIALCFNKQDDIRQDLIDLVTGNNILTTALRNPTVDNDGNDIPGSDESVLVITAYRTMGTGDKQPVTVEIETAQSNKDERCLTWATRDGTSQRLRLDAIEQVR